MRRQLALLVAATTSLVMLAFVIPLAVLVDRTADGSGVVAATARVQSVVPFVVSGDDEAAIAAATHASRDGFDVLVQLPGGRVGGAPAGSWAPPAGGGGIRATVLRRPGDGSAVVDQPVFRGDGTVVVSARVSPDELARGVHRAWWALAALGLVLVGISLLVAGRLARSMTGPVTALAAAAERLGGGQLDTRVEPAGPTEIRHVGAAMNTLAARVTGLLRAERESAADLSHRLRTPITALRLDAEGLADPEERARISADVDALAEQIDEIIAAAKRPVRDDPALPASCDVVAVVADRISFWRLLADDQQRPVTVDLPAGPVLVAAAATDLAAALDALLDNVFAHTAEGTGFAVRVSASAGGGAELTVVDEGEGFADAAVLSRGTSGAGSSGLGLDIARKVADGSGGSAHFDPAPGAMAVTLRLGPPRATAHP